MPDEVDFGLVTPLNRLEQPRLFICYFMRLDVTAFTLHLWGCRVNPFQGCFPAIFSNDD